MTGIVDQRLKPDAEQRNDMLASHLQTDLTRDELLAEAFLKMYVQGRPNPSPSFSTTAISCTDLVLPLNAVLPALTRRL